MSSGNVQKLNDELNAFLAQARVAASGMDADIRTAKTVLEESDKKISLSTERLEKLCGELDKVEEEAGGELDKLLVEQAEDLAEE